MRYIPPITKGEFCQMLQTCMPPTGWPKKLAVANSGGSDSTCLLYLLAEIMQNSTIGLPEELVSLHVNHALQPASDSMADHAAKLAERLRIPHLTLEIPWSTSPFPPRPTSGQSYEELARTARLNRLFHGMSQHRADAVALAHHADDQVETSIIRLSHGSSIYGAVGMKPVRRWGMGNSNLMLRMGEEGMRRWVVRPLLHVTKARILATCEANQLDYVNDPSNFQPEVTIRNYVRHLLAQRDQAIQGEPVSLPADLRPGIARLEQIDANLHRSINLIAQQGERIQAQVDSHLQRCTRVPHPSTLLLDLSCLGEIEDTEVRIALVRRVSRYISHHPWGSLRAQAFGKRGSLLRTVERIWGDSAARQSFTSGGGVLWVPVTIRADSQVRNREPREGERAGWLAQRAPPQLFDFQASVQHPEPLYIDITQSIKNGLHRRSECRILWDERFLLEFNPKKMPGPVAMSILDRGRRATISIEADRKWILPKVVWREGKEKVVLMEYTSKGKFDFIDHMGDLDYDIDWIQATFVRTLDAI